MYLIMISVAGILGLIVHQVAYPFVQEQRRRSEFLYRLRILSANPTDPATHAEFLLRAELRYWQNGEFSRLAYEKALEILARHPADESARQFAVQVGTWFYGRARPGGKLLYPDEMSLDFDIRSRAVN